MKNLLVLLMFILVAACASYHNETLKEQNDYVIEHNKNSDRLK